MNFRRPPLVLCLAALLAALLAGCQGNAPRPGPPAPVVTPEAGDRAEGREPRIAAYTPPARPRVARPAPKRAVAVLMRRAEDQRRAGDLAAAAASLERALRIAPRDPVLWSRLARVREQQRRYGMAVELAEKSNALAAPGDRALLRANWRLIARVRRAVGDTAGARAAARQASRY